MLMRVLALTALLLITASTSSGELVGRTARPVEEFDAQGHVTRTKDGTRRTYGRGEVERTSTAVAGDAGTPLPVATPQGVATAPAPGPEMALDFAAVWRTQVFGSGIGLAGLVPVDLDGDGTLEILAGSSSSVFGANGSWYVVAYQSATGGYAIRAGAPPLDVPPPLYSFVSVTAVTAFRIDGKMKILAGLSDGTLHVHDGATLAREQILRPTTSPIRKILLADANNDGAQDLVLFTDSGIELLDPSTRAVRRSVVRAAADGDVGQVDGDPALEVVLPSGAVLELHGASETVEWSFAPGFGSHVRLADFDGDGISEIVGSASWSTIRVYDALLQTLIFEIKAGLEVATTTVADVTGDGRPEILYGDGQWGAIHAIDGMNGQELWKIPNPDHGVTNIVVADTDGDGALEILWGAGHTSTGPDHLYVHSVTTRALEWVSTHVDGPFAAVALGDPDMDGENEIIAFSSESNSGYADGVGFAFDADTFASEWQSGTNLFEGFAWTGIHDVAVGDVNGDGSNEIVVATDRLYDGRLSVHDGRTHALLWRKEYDSGSPMNAVIVEDLDRDGHPEIVAGNTVAHTGSPGIFLYVIDGATGNVEWKSTGLGAGFSSLYTLETGDTNGDGVREILAVSGGRLVVADTQTHVLRFGGDTDLRSLLVHDMNGDGKDEIWVGSTNGTLYVVNPTTLTRELRGPACVTGGINALVAGAPAVTEGGEGIAFACEDSIGMYGVAEGAVLWRSPTLGSSVGVGDNLQVYRHAGRARLVVGEGSGLRAFDFVGIRDIDVDHDGLLNWKDNCPQLANPDQRDTDHDGVGDACNDAFDADGDEFADAIDRCPHLADPAQKDTDGDGVGDACNDASDRDGDEWSEVRDNCPDLANPTQLNADRDAYGDPCDPYPYQADHYRARCDEAVANEGRLSQELASCVAVPRFLDADADGEADVTDACPGTAPGSTVDEAGCSQSQACSTIPISGLSGLTVCAMTDWRNDEPTDLLPRDCRIQFGRVKGRLILVCAALRP